MTAGYVGICTFELHLPGSTSLKEKRMVLRSVKAQLQQRFGCSIAEVDHHDQWQRSRLTIALVTREIGDLQRLLDDTERWLHGQAFETAGLEREIVTIDDVRSLA